MIMMMMIRQIAWLAKRRCLAVGCPRPGRLDKVLYVPLPPPDGRASILRALTRRTPLAADVDVTALGESPRCDGFSGADMAALVREASVAALKDSLRAAASAATAAAGSSGAVVAACSAAAFEGARGGGGVRVAMRHFDAALDRVCPSVSRRDARMYEALRKSLRGNLRSGRCGRLCEFGRRFFAAQRWWQVP